jgi:hypothetical protein
MKILEMVSSAIVVIVAILPENSFLFPTKDGCYSHVLMRNFSQLAQQAPGGLFFSLITVVSFN